MVALRSRRLESVLGAPLDALTSEHIRGLVTSAVQEAFDLEFKVASYGRGDSDKRALAGDVAALANTAGGIIVLGVEEDQHARATATPGVELSDAEMARICQVVASLVAPMPTFDVLTVPEAAAVPSEPAMAGGDTPMSARGFVVIAVPRSPSAPHAVLINDALRYPKRNGATTRYLSESEVATAYRDRLAGAQRQAERVEEIELRRPPPALVEFLMLDRLKWAPHAVLIGVAKIDPILLGECAAARTDEAWSVQLRVAVSCWRGRCAHGGDGSRRVG